MTGATISDTDINALLERGRRRLPRTPGGGNGTLCRDVTRFPPELRYQEMP